MAGVHYSAKRGPCGPFYVRLSFVPYSFQEMFLKREEKIPLFLFLKKSCYDKVCLH